MRHSQNTNASVAASDTVCPDNGERTTEDDTLTWIKSSHSQMTGNCVEVARLTANVVGVRDSKNPLGEILRFKPTGWDIFLGGVRNGDFDHLPVAHITR